jgi:cyanophycinase-like exopeptidase
MTAVDGVDYSAGQLLGRLLRALQRKGIRPLVAEVSDDVRTLLDRYGIAKLLGPGAVYRSVGDVLRAYDAAHPSAAGHRQGAPTHA